MDVFGNLEYTKYCREWYALAEMDLRYSEPAQPFSTG